MIFVPILSHTPCMLILFWAKVYFVSIFTILKKKKVTEDKRGCWMSNDNISSTFKPTRTLKKHVNLSFSNISLSFGAGTWDLVHTGTVMIVQRSVCFQFTDWTLCTAWNNVTGTRDQGLDTWQLLNYFLEIQNRPCLWSWFRSSKPSSSTCFLRLIPPQLAAFSYYTLILNSFFFCHTSKNNM